MNEFDYMDIDWEFFKSKYLPIYFVSWH